MTSTGRKVGSNGHGTRTVHGTPRWDVPAIRGRDLRASNRDDPTGTDACPHESPGNGIGRRPLGGDVLRSRNLRCTDDVSARGELRLCLESTDRYRAIRVRRIRTVPPVRYDDGRLRYAIRDASRTPYLSVRRRWWSAPGGTTRGATLGNHG